MHALTHRSARAPSPNPRPLSPRPYLTSRPKPPSTLARLRNATLHNRLLRPLLFLLVLLLLLFWPRWGDRDELDDGMSVGKWIPLHVPDAIVHPHFPGMGIERKASVVDLSDDELDGSLDGEGEDPTFPEDEVDDPIPANPLALLEEDKQAAYDLYGEDTVNEVLEELYNPKPVVSSGMKGLFGFGGRVNTHLEEHIYLQNGLLLVNPRGRHPIYDLIEKAEVAWEAKVEKQSKTLGQAVAEYRVRWGKYPPKGFDKWWAYVQKHKIPLPDEYDQIMRDLSPYFAYSAADLRTLQQEMKEKNGTYTIASIPARDGEPGRLELVDQKIGESAIGSKRTHLQLELMRGYEELMPSTGEKDTAAEEEQRDPQLEKVMEQARREVEQALVGASGAWEATFSVNDGPQDHWNWEFGELMRVTIDAGKVLDLETKPNMERLGWAAGCPYNAPLRISPLTSPPPGLPNAVSSPKHFIHNHRLSMSPCLHPSHTHHVGTLSSHANGKGPGVQERRMFGFSLCKTELHGDIGIVPAERWEEARDDPTPWEEKDPRLVWRGSTTGISMRPGMPWRESQRIRLLSLLSGMNGSHPVLPPFSPTHPVGEPMLLDAAWLNPVLADVGFVKAPIQCGDGVCEELGRMFEWRSRMQPEELWRYKFLLDVDGNGWSARFHHLLLANSVVLKSTIFSEWYTDRIQPWVHYVPLSVDLSDLYDILTFFRGDVSRGGKGGHDELAQKIARQGREWSRAFWRKEDMVAYTFRLFLEYGRLMSDDRKSMEFRP